jgi:hypothetical protein
VGQHETLAIICIVVSIDIQDRSTGTAQPAKLRPLVACASGRGQDDRRRITLPIARVFTGLWWCYAPAGSLRGARRLSVMRAKEPMNSLTSRPLRPLTYSAAHDPDEPGVLEPGSVFLASIVY